MYYTIYHVYCVYVYIYTYIQYNDHINTINKTEDAPPKPCPSSVEVSWKSADRGWICAKRWHRAKRCQAVVKNNQPIIARHRCYINDVKCIFKCYINIYKQC